MNKNCIFVLFAIIAAAVASEASGSADVSDAKRVNNKYVAQVRVHIVKLLAKIKVEVSSATVKNTAAAKHCKKWIAMHSHVAKKSRAVIKFERAKIALNKKQQLVITKKLIPGAEKAASTCDKHKETLQNGMDKGDTKRKAKQAAFDKKVGKLSHHLKFVKHLYVFLMKSTVERRRNVKFLQEKSVEMHQHAAALNGKAASLMETGASMLVSGHLDAIYRLLDNLRGELQRQIRSAQRHEMRAARHWARIHSRLRATQIHWHKKSIRFAEQGSKFEMKEEMLDVDSENRSRKIDNNDLIAEHRERDLQVLKVRCHQGANSYVNRMHQWAGEKKALLGLRVKINNYYNGALKHGPTRRKR